MPTPKCWSCLGEDATVKIDGKLELVCGSCWKDMNPFQRVLLGLLLNDEDEGGLGVRAAFAVMSDRLMTEAFKRMPDAKETGINYHELFLAHDIRDYPDGRSCHDCGLREDAIIDMNISTCEVLNGTEPIVITEDEPAGGIRMTSCKSMGNTDGGGMVLPVEEKELTADELFSVHRMIDREGCTVCADCGLFKVTIIRTGESNCHHLAVPLDGKDSDASNDKPANA